MIQLLAFPLGVITCSALFYIIVGEKSNRSLCACVATMCSTAAIILCVKLLSYSISGTEEVMISIFVLSGISTVLTFLVLRDAKTMLPLTHEICASLLMSIAGCFISAMVAVDPTRFSDMIILVLYILFAITIILQALVVGYIYKNPLKIRQE